MPAQADSDPSASSPSEGFVEVCFRALVEAEGTLESLKQDAAQASGPEALRQLVRRVRGRAKDEPALGTLVPFIDALHAVPERLTREGHYRPEVGEIMLLGLDRLLLAGQSIRDGREITSLQLDPISRALRVQATNDASTDGPALRRTLDLLTGRGDHAGVGAPQNVSSRPPAPPVAHDDLTFFRELSLAVERRIPAAQGRFGRQARMAAQVNALTGTPVDPLQLEVAIHAHDLGMALLPDAILTKPARLTAEEWQELKGHPTHIAGVLARMSAWGEASLMVLQHHERPDGTGYPRGLKEAELTPGATLIAIIDAFEAMTHARAERSRKSVLRAVAEINACHDQFSRLWIPAFNQSVRQLLDEVD